VDDFKNLYLNNQLCFALYTATHAVTRSYREHLGEVGLTYPQYLVMLVLWQHQNQNTKELAEKLDLNTSSLTPILKSLENAGLITRERGNQNDRRVVVSLTVRGSEIQAQTSQIQQHVSCETGLTELEYIELKEKLTHMLDNFKIHVKRPDAWMAKLPNDL
jgi:MarR family transcriptional regulator, organic hydroperoxide resistance regulator